MGNAVNAWLSAFEAQIRLEIDQNTLDEQTLEAVDWSALTAWHLTLIQSVSELHVAEESLALQALLENELSAKSIFDAGASGFRGHRIYMLSNPPEMVCDVIGDLHSDPTSLMHLLKQTGFIESCLNNQPHRLIFMGDYVDRGKAHLALLGRLLLLKRMYPDRIFLLRGNHDGGILEGPDKVKLPYRKPDDEADEDYFPTYLLQLKKRCPETAPLLPAYLAFFNTLGQLAFINTGNQITLAVHGGLPRPVYESGHYFGYLKSLSELADEQHVDAFGRTMVQNIMWSDPYRGSGDLREGMGRFFYTEAQVEDFAKTVGIRQILRGHEAFDTGYSKHFGGKVYTIFSSGQWPESANNPMTAYPKVTAKWARVCANRKIEIHPKKTDICY